MGLLYSPGVFFLEVNVFVSKVVGYEHCLLAFGIIS